MYLGTTGTLGGWKGAQMFIWPIICKSCYSKLYYEFCSFHFLSSISFYQSYSLYSLVLCKLAYKGQFSTMIWSCEHLSINLFASSRFENPMNPNPFDSFVDESQAIVKETGRNLC